MGWQARPNVDEFTYTFDLGCLVEVASRDRFPAFRGLAMPIPSVLSVPDNIEIRSCRNDFHLLECHDIFKLCADFSRLPQQLRVQEMSHTPFITESKDIRSVLVRTVKQYNSTPTRDSSIA